MTTQTATINQEQIKLLVRGLYDVQKLRIQLQLRIDRLIREDIMTEQHAEDFFAIPFSKFMEAEKIMEKNVWREIKDLPIVTSWLINVKGIGPRLSGLLVANIIDISKFDTVSKLWAYAGLHVIEGKAAKRAKGEKANWNRELKTTAWKISESLIKVKGSYRELYDRYKTRIIEREINEGNIIYGTIEGGGKMVALHFDSVRTTPPEKIPTNPEWTAGRINNMALRYIAKRLLAHLWQVWREIEGIECRIPYCVEYLGHKDIDDPWDYVDKK